MDRGLNYSDIILTPEKAVVASRSECDVTATLGRHTFASPVCLSNMPAINNPQICKIFDENKWFYVYHRIGGVNDVIRFLMDYKDYHKTSISIGITEEWQTLLSQCIEWGITKIDYITIDVAHGHSERLKPLVDFVKSKLPNTYVIAGNVATGVGIEFLEGLGVDCAKVGIGVSEACRTRQFTGFGSTTVSSLIECKQAAKNIKIIADGGLTVKNGEVWIGDVAKAIKFGADMVMSGSLFSQCLDSPALLTGYYGNSTARAKGHDHHIEGTTVETKTNGLTTIQMMKLITDSLKSSVSYAGGKDLTSLRDVGYTVI